MVHDHWRAYLSLENLDHAFCNAHLLRELQAVCEFDKEPWAEALRRNAPDADEAARTAEAQGETALAQKLLRRSNSDWAAVREGLALHRRLPAFYLSTNPKKCKNSGPLTPAHPL